MALLGEGFLETRSLSLVPVFVVRMVPRLVNAVRIVAVVPSRAEPVSRHLKQSGNFGLCL